jgi:hypothetical protein
MILFLTYSISIGRPSQAETSMTLAESWEQRIGDGGTNSHTFAEDGETSPLVLHPTCDFASSVHMERQLQTCWHIHPPFHSSLITFKARLEEMWME